MDWLEGFAYALGISAIIGSLSEALVAKTKFEKYIRLIVALMILLVIFSFLLGFDYKSLDLDFGGDDILIPQGEDIAMQGAESLARVEIARQIEQALFTAFGLEFNITTIDMDISGDDYFINSIEFASFLGKSDAEILEIIEKQLDIDTKILEGIS